LIDIYELLGTRQYNNRKVEDNERSKEETAKKEM